jgi:MFS family permease
VTVQLPTGGRLGVALQRQFSSLAEYNFRVFFVGQVVSLIGTWMQSVGLAWLVLQLTSSELAVGFVTALQFLPMMLFALVGGVMADRLPKRRTLVVVQTAALVQAAVLGALVLAHAATLWEVYVLAFASGLTSAIERPTRQSYFVELVGTDRLPNAVALHSTILNGSRVLGPAIAGVLIATVGVASTFLFNAASYLAVLWGYALIRQNELHEPGHKRSGGSVFRQIGEGLSYAVHTPSTLFVFILLAFVGTFGYNFTVVIPLLARFVLHVGPARFGLLTSALGLGSFAAALAVAGAGPRSERFLVVSATAFSVCFGVLAVSNSYWLTAASLLLVGGAGTAFMTTANTTVQLLAPPHLRGRIVSIYLLLMAGSTPIGGFLTGALGSWLGVRWALGIEAVLCLAGVGVAWPFRSRRVAPVEAALTQVPAEAPSR